MFTMSQVKGVPARDLEEHVQKHYGPVRRAFWNDSLTAGHSGNFWME